MSGKNSPYCCHELVELLLGVLAAGVGVEHVVERAASSRRIRSMSSRRRVLQRVAQCRRTGRRAPRCAAGPGSAGRSAAPPASATGSRPAARTARDGVVRQRVELGLGHPGSCRTDRGTAPCRSSASACVQQLADLLAACRRAGRSRRSSRARLRARSAQRVQPVATVRCRGAAAGSARCAATCRPARRRRSRRAPRGCRRAAPAGRDRRARRRTGSLMFIASSRERSSDHGSDDLGDTVASGLQSKITTTN